MAQYNRFMGEYDDNTNYEKGDVVTFDGAAWYRKMAGSGISPIARKKPYTVWSRLSEALSTIFPLGGGNPGGTGTGLPSDVGPYKQMATDGEGNWVPVDRLAWKEVKEVDILPETTITTSVSNGVISASIVFDVVPVAGKTYNIEWNGVNFESISANVNGHILFGNGSLAGLGSDTGEPYLFGYSAQGLAMVSAKVAGEHTVRVYERSETIHPIPAEYLHNFNVNVAYDDDSEAYVSDKTYEQIKAAEAQKKAIIGTFTHKDGKVFTLIGCDATDAKNCKLIAFDINSYEEFYYYSISVVGDGEDRVEVSKFKIAATYVEE